ncbi:MAG: hypothetical protein HYT93_04855 [Parcubacteria group bacterium]|nr:hypothetical protein [Parcubacteria group bacterium]
MKFVWALLVAFVFLFFTIPAQAQTACKNDEQTLGTDQEPSGAMFCSESFTAEELKLETFLKEIIFQTYKNELGAFACTGFNLMESKSNAVLWASAGHCGKSQFIKNSNEDGYREVFNHFHSQIEPIDLFISTKETRGTLFEKYPELKEVDLQKGTQYYTLGSFEWKRDVERCLSVLEYIGKKEGYLVFKQGRGCSMIPGTSGSPIISAEKVLVGVSNGSPPGVEPTEPEFYTHYRATDPYQMLNLFLKYDYIKRLSLIPLYR